MFAGGTHVAIGNEEQLLVGEVFESWQKRFLLVVLFVDFVRLEGFPDAAIVRDVLSQRLESVDLGIQKVLRFLLDFGSITHVVFSFRDVVTVVLLNEARRPVDVLPYRTVRPPLFQVAVFVELSTCNIRKLCIGKNFYPQSPRTHRYRRIHASARALEPSRLHRSSAP